MSYFGEIFTSSGSHGSEEVCEKVRSRVSVDNHTWCSRQFVVEDVREALKHMHPTKALGPVGIPALFYQKFWNIMGKDIETLVLDILNEGRNLESLNKTFICLIPKCKNPRNPKDFRPISLYNVAMKLVTKCIANRLKPLLPKIIDEQQSAFVHQSPNYK